MENNLYYIPKLSEFHIGFEYEYQEEVNGEFKPKVFYGFNEKEFNAWIRVSVYTPDCIVPIFYRVKTLDQSDIESLGWELTHQFNGLWWELNKLIPDAEEMWHPLGNWKYRLIISDNHGLQIDGRNSMNGGQRIMFNGTIKNKSELIKLMQQLNIK